MAYYVFSHHDEQVFMNLADGALMTRPAQSAGAGWAPLQFDGTHTFFVEHDGQRHHRTDFQAADVSHVFGEVIFGIKKNGKFAYHGRAPARQILFEKETKNTWETFWGFEDIALEPEIAAGIAGTSWVLVTEDGARKVVQAEILPD